MTMQSRQDLDMVLPAEAVEVALRTVEEIIGKAGLRTVARQVGLDDLLDEQGGLKPGVEVRFQHVGKMTRGLLEVYGERGAAAMLRRAGRIQFQRWLEAYPTALGVAGAALRALPPDKRLEVVLKAVSAAARRLVGVETEVTRDGERLAFRALQCPYCAGVTATRPFCLTAVGALEEVARWATGQPWRVRETSCMAQGDPACVFEMESGA